MNENGNPDAASFAGRGFGNRIGFGRSPALLIIDLLKAFTDRNRPLGADLDDVVAATNQLIDAAHDADVPVLFFTVRYDLPNLADAGIWAAKMSGLATLRADQNGSDLDPRLHRAAADAILMKKYASCFFGTDLVSRLNSMHRDTLLITGCTTSGCVRATVVDACQYGYRPMVVREAVGDRAATAHAQSIFDMDAKYADIVSLADAEAYLRRPGGITGLDVRTATVALETE